MSALEIALAAAALAAGLTGTWSPCGFSMIETIGPRGHRGGAAVTLAACITFTAGALAGGIATFGSLAELGSLAHGAGGEVAYALAAALALAAAVLEARAAPILPQVRRQLPEHWRREMPMPVAAALYGVLLGLGFTTFVLTFGVFALAGMVVAVGEPAAGIVVGLAFGVGRALPIAFTAPIADRPLGMRVTELMASRPAILAGFRAVDAAALTACAVVLVLTVPADAAKVEHTPAADPSTSGKAVAFQRPDGSGVLDRAGHQVPMPGRDPALGGGRAAVIAGDGITILSAGDLTELGHVRAPGVDAVAISKRWLVWRARIGNRDVVRARELGNPARPGPERSLARIGGSGQLGRPSLDGNRLVYARADRRENVIARRTLGASGKRAKATLLRSRTVGLSNPAIRGPYLLYVRHTSHGDLLKLARAGRGEGRTLLSRRNGTLWSTALTAKRAYVTQISGSLPQQRILSVNR